jgi:hypothetical protein
MQVHIVRSFATIKDTAQWGSLGLPTLVEEA